jgi:TolB-like protein
MTSPAGQTPSRGSAAPKPRVVLIPFDLPEHIPAWTADDDRVLAAAILAALRQAGDVTISAAPAGTETPRDRAAIARAGRTLHADYLIEGGVTEFGSGFDGPRGSSALQITFQLFDGRTGALVWVDEANASSVAQPRAAAVREMSQAAARTVAERVAKTDF